MKRAVRAPRKIPVMSLSTYKKKRSFHNTPEPKGKKVSSEKVLRFVVQKHHASHLHYDFRLEMEGVLKSWAVPKGPSTDPANKRLAMMVEDHPYDYRDFEGIIPKGNYGAGTVIVWDEGTYEPLEKKGTTVKDDEKNLLQQLHAGQIKFILHGHKMKGEWVLVKTPNAGENAWLMIKHRDKYASTDDITKKEKSVKSKMTLEQVAKKSNKTWISNRKSGQGTEKKTAKITSENTTLPDEVEAILRKGKKAPVPHDIEPMLATVVDKPFDNPEWLYEIKWDGYRAVAYLDRGKVEIRSRNNLSFTAKFAEITETLQQWPTRAVTDGEIIALNDAGIADFQQLQGFAQLGKSAHLVYYIFDLLWYEGQSLMHLPLKDRKLVLENIIPTDQDTIRYSDHIEERGKEFSELALKQGLEGIMAKKADSEYILNFRTNQWLKIKNTHRMEAIICGFTKPRNSRKFFGAVILGKYEKEKLVYIGHSGSGFDDKTLKDLYKKFQPLIVDECPFETKPATNAPVTWVKPRLVCEVKFSEWTKDKLLRHPIFLGLREDKTAKNEKNEKVVPAPAPGKSKKVKQAEPIEKLSAPRREAARKKEKQFIAADQKQAIVIINKKELTLTNLDKIYWPTEKISKRDMLNYYYAILPFMLPYMKDRPQSLNRYPNGIKGPSFYQKNVDGKVADWIKTHPYTSESDGKKKNFLVCSDEATLIYMANLGCIEMNPWHSRVQSPDNPDWCVIDLDPDDDNTFDQVVEAAHAVKQVLDSFKIPSCCKTSGSTGMHIYIPLGANCTYDQSRMLAEVLVHMVHDEIPDFTSLERNPKKRKGKIYLDYLQNRAIQTIAAPYSLRPKPGATVSAPLHWDEVKAGLSISDFNIFNMIDRVKEVGDLFKPALGKGINLTQLLKKIESGITT